MHRSWGSLKPTSVRGDIYLSLFLVTVLSWLVIGDAYNTRGNGGDILIPYLSGQALQQGLALHTLFHSILGWIYHYLNFTIFSLILHSNGILKEAYLIGMSSAVAGVFISVIYILANAFAPFKERVHPVFLIIALSICFTPRWLVVWSYDVISPNGMYSKHCAALLFVHAGICLQWYLSIKKNSSATMITKPFYILCLLQAVIFYCTFNYKITGFLSHACLAGGLFFILPNNRQRLAYALIIAGIFLSLTLITAAFGYSYSGYLNDLLFSSKAKASYPLSWNSVFTSILIFSILYIWLPNFSSRAHALKKFVFSLSAAISFLVCVWSITSLPFVYSLVFAAACFYSLNNAPQLRHLKSGAVFFIVFFCGLNFLSAVYQKFNSAEKTYMRGMAAQGLAGPEYLDLVESFQLDKKDPRFYLGLSSTYVLDDTNALIFSVSDDIQSWNNAADFLRSNSISEKDIVSMIGFTNPFPSLLSTPLPEETWHWKHLAINIPAHEAEHIFSIEAESTDIFYMPMLTPLTTQIQSILNCGFYKYNYSFDNPPFKAVHITPSFLLWARDSFLKKKGLTEIPLSKGTHQSILVNCADSKEKTLNRTVRSITRMSYKDIILLFDLQRTNPENFIRLAFGYQTLKNPWANFEGASKKASETEIIAEIKQHGLSKKDVFTSPLPSEKFNKLALQDKKIVIIPVLSLGGENQTEKNCAVFRAPEISSKEFHLYKVTPYNLYWSRKKPVETSLDLKARSIINSLCSAGEALPK